MQGQRVSASLTSTAPLGRLVGIGVGGAHPMRVMRFRWGVAYGCSRDWGSAIDAPAAQAGSSRLSLLLAAAMFVLVVDTSLMNVSIAAVVKDLDTTVS